MWRESQGRRTPPPQVGINCRQSIFPRALLRMRVPLGALLPAPLCTDDDEARAGNRGLRRTARAWNDLPALPRGTLPH